MRHVVHEIWLSPYREYPAVPAAITVSVTVVERYPSFTHKAAMLPGSFLEHKTLSSNM